MSEQIPKEELQRAWRDYAENVIVAIVLAIIVRGFILTAYKVPTGSMSPTLVPGDFIFAFRPPYGLRIPFTSIKLGGHLPERGEVVVFTYPEQPKTNYVKRVIGLPGDVVQIKNGVLFVNDRECSQTLLTDTLGAEVPEVPGLAVYVEKAEVDCGRKDRRIIRQKDKSGAQFGPLVVPPNEVFLLGDHRDASDDSRFWGTVPFERVEGRVVFIWMSLDWSSNINSTLERTTGASLPSVRWSRIFTSL